MVIFIGMQWETNNQFGVALLKSYLEAKGKVGHLAFSLVNYTIHLLSVAKTSKALWRTHFYNNATVGF